MVTLVMLPTMKVVRKHISREDSIAAIAAVLSDYDMERFSCGPKAYPNDEAVRLAERIQAGLVAVCALVEKP